MAEDPSTGAELQAIVGLMLSMASIVQTIVESGAVDAGALKKRLEFDREYMKKEHGKTGVDVVEHMLEMVAQGAKKRG